MNEELKAFINSPGMWIACSFMVIIVVTQSIIFLGKAIKHAPEVGLTKDQCIRGARSSIISSIGPSLSPVIVLVSLVAVLGAPTTWMRLNDIGAGRTELAMANMAVSVMNADLSDASTVTTEVFVAAITGQALCNVGWMIVTLLVTPRMSTVLTKMNAKLNPKLVSMIMTGATLGIFAYSVNNQIIGRALPYLIAVLSSAAAMIVLNKVFARKQRILELSLGLSMIVGMIVATVAASAMG